MGVVSNPLTILLMAWGIVTALLVVLVIYSNTLNIHEDEDSYINAKEEARLGGGHHEVLIVKMERLMKVMVSLAMVSGVLLLASVTIWVYTGLMRG
jgi:hypothetical protein